MDRRGPLHLRVRRIGRSYEAPTAAAFLLAADATSGTRCARARASAGIVLADTDPAAARAQLEQARAEGQVLLADAGLATLRGEDPGRTAAIVDSLRRTPPAELDQEPAALAVLGRAAVQAGDPAAAVSYHSRALEAASRYHETTGHRLVLADALRRRALTNPDHSVVDFDQAAAHARAALQARRAWDGPSAEALTILLDILLAQGRRARRGECRLPRHPRRCRAGPRSRRPRRRYARRQRRPGRRRHARVQLFHRGPAAQRDEP